jgi:hypothetical protein
MLSEEDKQRIIQEERFRLEVRKSLAPEKPDAETGQLWKFLNSGFGLWLLSTVVIGLIGWAYAQWQGSQENLAQSSALIDKLDVEIEARLAAAEWFHTSSDNARTLANRLLSPPSEENVVQPEFAKRNLKSLMYELHGRLAPGNRIDVYKAITSLRLIETEYADKELAESELLKEGLIENFLTKVRELRDMRWVPGKSIDRRAGRAFYEISLIILWLLVVLLLLLYGMYRLVKLVWQTTRKLKNESVKETSELLE